MTEQAIEQEIQDKGKTAPRITPDHIDSVIKAEEYHVLFGTPITICVITLQNGFTVTGESVCASPENFDVEIGRKIARENAREKIWVLEGYLLKQRLFESSDIPLSTAIASSNIKDANSKTVSQMIVDYDAFMARADHSEMSVEELAAQEDKYQTMIDLAKSLLAI